MRSLRGALLLACLSLAGCRREQPKEPPERLVLAVAQLPHAALMHVAIEKGLLAANGLTATVQKHPFGKPALEAVLAGEADVATVAETPVVLAALRGEKLAVLATISSATRNTVLVARRSAGISSGATLAGKRIGLPLGTNAEFFLDTLLVRHRVEAGAVEMVDLKPAELLGAMTRREVDAIACWHPFVVDVQDRLGEDGLSIDAEDVYLETHQVVARAELVRERPAAMERLLRALVQAEVSAREDPQAARRHVAAALGREDLDRVMATFDYRVRLDQSVLMLLEQQARWARRTGLVPGAAMPNFLDMLAPGPLQDVNPDAVGLIRPSAR